MLASGLLQVCLLLGKFPLFQGDHQEDTLSLAMCPLLHLQDNQVVYVFK